MTGLFIRVSLRRGHFKVDKKNGKESVIQAVGSFPCVKSWRQEKISYDPAVPLLGIDLK